MKKNRLFLLLALLLPAACVFAQSDRPILFKTGPVRLPSNIKKIALDSFHLQAARFRQKTFAVIQFETLPSETTRKMLSARGIELLEYLPDNAYTVSITGNPDISILQSARARSIYEPTPQQKMDIRLASGNLPSSSIKTEGTIDVSISFPKTFSASDVVTQLRQQNFDIVSTQHQAYRILSLRIAQSRLTELAALPFIEYVQAAPPGDQPLNGNSQFASRANVLSASVANGGRGLNGEGVVVGVGDNSDIQTHIDFAGRVINRAAAPSTGHGHHVTGTIAGAGNGNEQFRGYAPKVTIVSQYFGGIIANAAAYVNDYGMVITNNSYGDNIECSYYGTYDLYSRLLDQIAFDHPYLSNVFAAGNSGQSDCAPFQPGYHTVLGGYQSAKNIISVGAASDSALIAAGSSKGPVRDGRVKPDITSMGRFVASAWPTNIYSYSSGTSMAAPAVSGGLALLYQRYRQLNGGTNPKNGLMKALVCNGAADRGNAGPDYQYGFGWLNLLRSVDMMENNRYFIGSSTGGSVVNHSITVPANTAQLKVMLYWNDPAASPMSAKTLVNDIDLEVAHGSVTTLPGVLDTSNAGVSNVAVNGADHINNMEQVIISSPSAGTYNLIVKGTAITQNPSQEYFLVYDIIPVQLKITSPAGGEAMSPSTFMSKISWEANGFSSGTVTIEFSANGGTSWSPIATGVNINREVYSWWVPDSATSEAMIRISRDGGSESATSNAFAIVGQPVVSLAPVQCEGYFSVQWTPVTGASDYEVMLLQEGEMKSAGITAGNSYTISGLSKDSVFWVSVRARINGKPGRRAPAVSRQPVNGTCSGAISDGDLKIDDIIAPGSGRRFTSTQLSSATAITVRVKNLDDGSVSNYDLKYSINGAPFITENISTAIAAGGTYDHTFSVPADLSVPGSYHLVVVVKNLATDMVTANDTAWRTVKHADNQPLDLTSVFTDNFESAVIASYDRDTVVLNGAERYDFSNATVYGRLRTFVNTGIAFSGAKALTLDADRYYPSGNINYLYGTYNLVNYDAAVHDIRVDFQYNNHGQVSNVNNKLWIRGNDGQPWIEAYDLDDYQNEPGTYKKSASIEVGDILVANGQNFSTSFQARWGQWGQIPATDKWSAGGYSFDDIRLYQVFNDIQMQSIDAPVQSSCGLTGNTIIRVSIRNSANTAINNIPVKYRINNGTWVIETISSIAANATLQYSFTTTADLSALTTYTLQAIVDLGSDSFRDNDTTTLRVINSPIITSFPYLQNFEASQGYWYADGKNSSWQYGMPISTKINTAASGVKAWKTRLQGNYNDYEKSYLYSPCFDLTGLSQPTLSFSMAMDLEDCGTQLCDAFWVEYSVDGIAWAKLGAYGQGTNWYNKIVDQLWSIQNYNRWHVATIPLPVGLNRLRVRFVLSSDPAVNREGVGIDDIHIYENTKGIYDGITLATPITQSVSGSGWIDFTSGGKLVASIQPNNQILGATEVQAFIHTGKVRYTATQYYLDRNITIKPASNPNDSVSVRLYYLDKEADSLINATGCAGCSKPASAYGLGVSKYTDSERNFENGNIGDNQQGIWNFIAPGKLQQVPFDKGYYAEFKVKDFSEFWLNNGGMSHPSPLPAKLLEFIAGKTGDHVLLKWKTASETNVEKYEIEVARGNAELQAGRYGKIGEVLCPGNTTGGRDYSFTDTEADKFGPRYYRLKVLNIDGTFTYSPMRSVIFDEPSLWQIYPNPSNGLFYLVYQLNSNELVYARVLDAKGSIVTQTERKGNGFVQKLSIDLQSKPAGVYLLQITTAGKTQTFKLYKR